MIMWKFKSCPRCGGDIFVNRDQYGWHKQCLQCGYLCYMPSTVKVHQQGEVKEEKELLGQPK